MSTYYVQTERLAYPPKCADNAEIVKVTVEHIDLAEMETAFFEKARRMDAADGGSLFEDVTYRETWYADPALQEQRFRFQTSRFEIRTRELRPRFDGTAIRFDPAADTHLAKLAQYTLADGSATMVLHKRMEGGYLLEEHFRDGPQGGSIRPLTSAEVKNLLMREAPDVFRDLFGQDDHRGRYSVVQMELSRDCCDMLEHMAQFRASDVSEMAELALNVYAKADKSRTIRVANRPLAESRIRQASFFLSGKGQKLLKQTAAAEGCDDSDVMNRAIRVFYNAHPQFRNTGGDWK